MAPADFHGRGISRALDRMFIGLEAARPLSKLKTGVTPDGPEQRPKT
jgi:hypothetical protein